MVRIVSYIDHPILPVISTLVQANMQVATCTLTSDDILSDLSIEFNEIIQHYIPLSEDSRPAVMSTWIQQPSIASSSHLSCCLHPIITPLLELHPHANQYSPQ